MTESSEASAGPFHVSFVEGVTPGKWLRTWDERMRRTPIEATMVTDDSQFSALYDGTADMAFVRGAVDRDRLHLIALYDEVPVVVVPKEHPVAELAEVDLSDLSGEQLLNEPVPGWVSTAEPLDFPPMTTKQAIEVIASGTGIVIVPMSVARLHRRKDVVSLPVTGVQSTNIGLAWALGNEDPRLETFIGIVRGRTARSSREEPTPPQPKKKAPAKTAGKATAKQKQGTKRLVSKKGTSPRRSGSKRRQR
ncbi:MAG: LysR family transcriptional regulator [Marmoricola sp.]|nr:LysR family transcriptional regulator [Marmoricola sp.]